MVWSRPFIALLRFAERASAIEGVSIDDALLHFTPLYPNFGLTYDFNPQDSTWREFLAGYHAAAQPLARTYSFYLAHARQYGVSPFGCFSYTYEPEERAVRLHFADRDASAAGPLSAARQAARHAELTALLADVRRNIPTAEAVRGRSWLYNLDAYRRLFPPTYIRTALPVAPGFQFMSLWGQFLDRQGGVRPKPGAGFLERIATATTLEALACSFPLPVRAPCCPIKHFYAHYSRS